MKADTVLDFAVFQLTPTRTRCELLISSNGVTEKLASSLLKPFLSHLKAVEEQIAAGGYSIKLQPPAAAAADDEHDNSWFTKGTMQKFVRFVNTPEVLERVSAVESELLRLEDELRAYYTQEADDHPTNLNSNLAGKSAQKPGTLVKQNSGDICEPETTESSRSRLLKAMEARQSVLQREQGMAFARAIAAGFDTDHLPDLIAFADHFGASRLREACVKLAALCKKQEEGGLWLDEIELVAAENAFAYGDTNGTGMDAFANNKDMVDEDDSSSIKCVDDRKDYHQRRSSGSFPEHMLGMPPQGPYGPGPWMQFGNEHGYDPRFFPPPQNMMPAYGNGNYPPYWAAPPGSFNGHPGNDVEDEGEEKSAAARKKISPRRKSSSPLKKIQVGRSGKRSGMVLIRNINYIASQDKKNANGSGNENSEETSEFESDDDEAGMEKHLLDEVVVPRKKKTKSKKSAAVESEGGETFVMPERSSSGTGLESSSETFVMPERSTSRYGGGQINFDTETNRSQHQQKRPPNVGGDDSFILEGGGAKGAGYHGQYGFDELASGRTQASKDGVVLPERLGGRHHLSSNHESELAFRRASGSDRVDESFIVPQREDSAYESKAGYQVDAGRPKGAADGEIFIVPSRNGHDSTRRTLELDEQLLYKEKSEDSAPKFEAVDMFILPERSAEKESTDKRWTDIDYDMEAMASLQTKQEHEEKENVEESEFHEQYQEQRDAKILKESGSKKAAREAKMKSLQDTLDKRKAEISSRFKSTRSSILKSKKEKEEDDRRRVEEQAEERRNRIAARSGGGASTNTRAPASSRSSITSSRSLNSRTSTVSKDASRNPLTRSVTSLSAKTRPPHTQDGKLQAPSKSIESPARKTSAAPSLEERRAKLQTRKSIASIRELKNPGAPKVPATKGLAAR